MLKNHSTAEIDVTESDIAKNSAGNTGKDFS